MSAHADTLKREPTLDRTEPHSPGGWFARHRSLVVILAAALGLRLFALRLFFTSHPPTFLFAHPYEMGLVANSLIHGLGYSSPFGGSTGPTAIVAPGYPTLIAPIFLVFGSDTFASALVITGLQIVVSLLTIWLMMHVAREMLDSRAATLAGALVSNVYTPIYDTILIGPAVTLAAGVMLRCAGNEREVFGGWLALLYIVPWLTQSFAEFLRFQPLTLILAGFAWWALGWVRRSAGGQEDAQSQRPQDIDFESSEGSGAYQTQGSTYHRLLGLTSYAVSCLTRNSGRCLSVFLRSYSPAPAILWERDR